MPSPAAAVVTRVSRMRRGATAAVLAYLGGLALLLFAAARAVVRPNGPAPPLWPTVLRHLDRLLGLGVLLVAMLHAPMGSFLAMQAYFLATFREATGAVVGVGLMRNLAPLLSGIILAGMLAARVVPELRRRPRHGLDLDPDSRPDRDAPAAGSGPESANAEPDPARLAAVRIIAAVIAAPVLAVWGTAVGLAMGLLVAMTFLSLSPGIYFGTFWDQIALDDAGGLLFKSVVFGLVAGLFAGFEGLRGDDDPRRVPAAVGRALCFSIVVILITSDCWFTLNYLSGEPFGPGLAAR